VAGILFATCDTWDCTIMLIWSLAVIPIEIERELQHAYKDRKSDYKQERTMAGKTHPWTSQAAGHGEVPSY